MPTGRLITWTAERAVVQLDDVAYGEIVDIAGTPSIVTALLANQVEVAPLSSREPPGNAEVRRIGPLVVPVGLELVGRAIDCLGRPLDSEGPLPPESSVPIIPRVPAVVDAGRGRRLTLGAMVYDLQRVVRAGTSLLATGRREVLHHILRHQIACGRVVVVASPCVTAPNHLALRRGDLQCIHVAAAPDATAAQCWLVPLTAMAIGEGLRARGCEVVVALDDLDAWKPHVTQSPRAPWATQLGQLASRAYATRTGSLSLIAMTRKLTTARAQAFDELLDLGLAMRGEIPFTGTKRVQPPFRTPSTGMLGSAVVVAEQTRQTEEAAGLHRGQLDEGTRDVLAKGRVLRESLRHRIGATVDLLEQQLSVMAVIHQRGIRAKDATDFVDAFLARVRRDHSARLAKIRAAGALDTEDLQSLLASAVDVGAAFGAP